MTSEAELESVILLRTHDAVRARMVRALLEEERIVVATPGHEHHSLMPHVGAAIEIVVRVPKKDLERARELVTEMEREVEEEPVPSENAPYREAAKKRPTALSPRLKRISVVATFVFPGGGHLYVQRLPGAGLVIVGYVLAGAAMFLEVPWGALLVPLVWLADLLGSLDGVDAGREPPRSSFVGRHAPLLSIAATVVWSGLAMGPLLPMLAGPASVTWCEYEARCAGWRTEQSCLLDAANWGDRAASSEDPCIACVGRARDCDLVRLDCAAVCAP